MCIKMCINHISNINPNHLSKTIEAKTPTASRQISGRHLYQMSSFTTSLKHWKKQRVTTNKPIQLAFKYRSIYIYMSKIPYQPTSILGCHDFTSHDAPQKSLEDWLASHPNAQRRLSGCWFFVSNQGKLSPQNLCAKRLRKKPRFLGITCGSWQPACPCKVNIGCRALQHLVYEISSHKLAI